MDICGLICWHVWIGWAVADIWLEFHVSSTVTNIYLKNEWHFRYLVYLLVRVVLEFLWFCSPAKDEYLPLISYTKTIKYLLEFVGSPCKQNLHGFFSSGVPKMPLNLIFLMPFTWAEVSSCDFHGSVFWSTVSILFLGKQYLKQQWNLGMTKSSIFHLGKHKKFFLFLFFQFQINL